MRKRGGVDGEMSGIGKMCFYTSLLRGYPSRGFSCANIIIIAVREKYYTAKIRLFV